MEEKKEHLGIPKAEFIEDIQAAAPTMEKANALYQEKDELLRKYRLLESHLIRKSRSLKGNRPDVLKNLSAVKKLKELPENGTTKVHYQVSDGLYSNAQVSKQSTVCLWLGAQIMVEYPLDEAEVLLQKNLSQLEEQISQLDSDLEYLRDQIITTEVTQSRLANQIIAIQRAKK